MYLRFCTIQNNTFLSHFLRSLHRIHSAEDEGAFGATVVQDLMCFINIMTSMLLNHGLVLKWNQILQNIWYLCTITALKECPCNGI